MSSEPDSTRGVSILLLLIGAAAVYFAVLFVGPYFDNYEVKQAIALELNHARQSSDFAIRSQILRGSLASVGTHCEESGGGRIREVSGLGLKEENILIQRDPDGRVLIRIEYERQIRLKPFDRCITWKFVDEKQEVPPSNLTNPAGG